MAISKHSRVLRTLIPGIGFVLGCAANAASKWSWQERHAKVLPTGDLEWGPMRFEFKLVQSTS